LIKGENYNLCFGHQGQMFTNLGGVIKINGAGKKIFFFFCDWPCNLQGVYACPAHKSIFMRDRQPNGNIGQIEVLEATCSSTQVPTVPIVVNNMTPEPNAIIPPPYYPPPAPPMPNNIPQQPSPGMNSNGLGYQSCAPSSEWFVSERTIRCSQSYAATGYAPDPKDCSKYYACDSYIGRDGMASGVLMQCLAGLWWDQQRRTCVLPSEVACNPYNIINSQGQNPIMDINTNMMNSQEPLPPPPPAVVHPAIDTTQMGSFPQGQSPIQPGSGSSGTFCRGVPLCVDVGLNILQQMKGIPGRPGWFYKCDSQCALEMRCPPGLVFDDLYQRCEWPGAVGMQASNHRLSSLRNKKDDIKNEKKQMRLMTTIKQENSTVSSSNKVVEP